MSRPTIKTFLLKIALFAVLFFLIDNGVGYIHNLLEKRAVKVSPYGMVTRYTMDVVNTDVVIIGSSQASHSYVSQILQDSLGVSVYNCGKDGSFFYYQNAMVNGILDRYAPKKIIWSIPTNFLATPSVEEINRLSDLNPYYRTSEYCHSTILKKSKFEFIKMSSSLYAYNSRLLPLIFKNIMPDYKYQLGYAPIYGQLKNDELKEENYYDDLSPDVELVFANTIQRCKDTGVEVMFVLTPKYETGDYDSTVQFKRMKEMILTQGFFLIEDLYRHPELMSPEFFKDRTHLNHDGAIAFSKMLASEIISSSPLTTTGL